jgi:polysaccharide export outer membrane protein
MRAQFLRIYWAKDADMKRSLFSRYKILFVIAALALTVAAVAPLPAHAQDAAADAAQTESTAPPPVAPVSASVTAPAPDTSAAPPSAGASSASLTIPDPMGEGYVLGTGDRVRVIVFGEADLSGEFFIDSTGRVALPLVGEVKAEGLSVRQFERAVENLLKVDYLKDPRVSVEVLNFRPFYILGEVSRPGTYPYTSGLTVLNAVVTAGGFTYRANKGSVKIQHQGSDKEQSVKLTPGLLIQPGDTITVKERWY